MKKKLPGEDIAHDMDTIIKYIQRSKKVGLSVEMICWAFYAIRADPTLSIAEALELGCIEWDF